MRLSLVRIQEGELGDWRSGSAAPLHGDGRWFKSDIAHGTVTRPLQCGGNRL